MATMLLLLSALVGAAGLYPYLRATINGSVRPQLVTWSIWTVLAGVLTVSSLLQHEVASAVLSAQSLVGCGVVVALGWRQGRIRLTRLDILCIVGAVIGVGSLVWLRDPATALWVTIAVDAVAFVPTLRHAWSSPAEESLACYALSSVAAMLALLVAILHQAPLTGLAYPIYSLTFNGATAIILLIGRQVYDEVYGRDSGEAVDS